MPDVTLVLRVPEELQEAIINIVDQIISIKDQVSPGNTEKEEYIKDAAAENPQGFQPPSFEEVRLYMMRRCSPVNPGRFYSWMKEHNWIDGRGNPITDWKQKVEDWEKKSLESPKPKWQQNKSRKAAQQTIHTKEPMQTPPTDDLERLEKMMGIKKEEKNNGDGNDRSDS